MYFARYNVVATLIKTKDLYPLFSYGSQAAAFLFPAREFLKTSKNVTIQNNGNDNGRKEYADST